MRTLMLPVVPIFLMLSGCAGSVIFGHTIGREDSTSTVQASAPERAPPQPATPATAPPGNTAPAAPATPTPASSPAPAPVKSVAVASVDAKLSAVTVTFTSAAREKVDAEPGFNQDALIAAIRTDLQRHQLLDDGADTHSGRTLEIVIEDFAARPASNAVVLGYTFSNATLSGKVGVRDADGRAPRTFNVKADRRLSARTDGGQAPALDPLYERFADVTVSELTGVPGTAPGSSGSEVPR